MPVLTFVIIKNQISLLCTSLLRECVGTEDVLFTQSRRPMQLI